MPDNTARDANEPNDPFDPMSLRATGDSGIRFEKPLHTVPLRRPPKQQYFRVCPDEGFSDDWWGIADEQDKGEIYIVAPACCELVANQVHLYRLFTCITTDGTIYIWPVKLPGDGDNTKSRAWSESALEIAEEAKQLWVGQVIGNMHLGAYDRIIAHGDLGEPKWPGKTFEQLLGIAFKDRVITTADHPMIRKLNGEL